MEMCTSPIHNNHNVLTICRGASRKTGKFIGQRTGDIWKRDAEFLYPVGLSVYEDPLGWNEKMIAVADSGNSAVKIFNRKGIIHNIKEKLRRPHGVAFARDCCDYIMVTDTANKSLTKHSLLDGKEVQIFNKPDVGSTANQMKQPSYVECGSDGGRELYVADTLGKVIKIFDSRSHAVVNTLGPFSSPHGLCIGSEAHTLVVADFGQSSIDALDLRKGKIVTHIAGVKEGLIGPTDVAYHVPSRRVLVLDMTRGKLLHFPVLPQLPESADFDFSSKQKQDKHQD